MKPALMTCVLLASTLHAAETPGFAVYSSINRGLGFKDQVEYHGPSVGLSLRILDSERPRQEFRLSVEKGINVKGASSTYEIKGYYILAADYLWHPSRFIYLGPGLKATRFEVVPPQPDQDWYHWTNSFGKKNSLLPQFVLGWSLNRHFSIEMNTSIVQDCIQVRYSF